MKHFSLPTDIFRRIKLVAYAILFAILVSFLTLSPVHAQECDSGPDTAPPATDREAIRKINLCSIESNIFDDKIFNLNQIAGTVDSLNNLLTGRSRLHTETNDITAGTGAVAASSSLVATMYSFQPISGVDYLAGQMEKLNPIQPVYAQQGGIGYSALLPVQNIWSVFRNISYVGFVIVFVIMGFMIMFRAKISPQAVATVQDSIPRITIALILVTFSYAIAGLFIDIMFLLLNIIVNTLEGAGLLTTNTEGIGPAQKVFEKSVFGVTRDIWKDVVTSVGDAVANTLDQVIDLGVLDKIIGFFGGGIASILAGIAILFIMFRVFLQLLMAYVMIIILTMFAPFFFLAQALPGVNGASTWFRQMASNVAVFPAIALMFIFAAILGGFEGLGGSGGSEFTSERIGQFPLLSGDLEFANIGKLIGFGILLMTPSAGDMIKKAIGTQGQGPGLGAQAAPVGAAAGFAGRRVAESTPGKTIANLSRAASERGQQRLMDAAPTFITGGQKIKKHLPEFSPQGAKRDTQ